MCCSNFLLRFRILGWSRRLNRSLFLTPLPRGRGMRGIDLVLEAQEGEDIVYAELRAEKIEETRRGIPIYGQRRFDVYPDVSESG